MTDNTTDPTSEVDVDKLLQDNQERHQWWCAACGSPSGMMGHRRCFSFDEDKK